jgi:adenosylhomocysteine nucleosidase
MPEVLMICAMPIEAQAAPPGWRVRVSGPGFQLASLAVEEELEKQIPDLVVSAGTCGALRPDLALGQVVAVQRVLSGIGEFALHTLAGRPAVLHSQDRVAVSTQEKAALAAGGADVVDMEAAAIARICRRRGVPLAAMKAVSDLAAEDLPLDFNLYRRPDGSFRLPSIAFAGIMNIRGLLRLQRQTRLAVENLGDALAQALA